MTCTATDSIQTLAYSRATESLPVLGEEVEEAVRKAGKSPGADTIPSEVLKNGGETTTTVLIDEEMAEGVDTIARHTFTIERLPQAM